MTCIEKTPCLRRFRASAAALVAMLALSACGSDTTFWSHAAAPKANKVELVSLTHDVGFQPRTARIDPRSGDELAAFLSRHDVGYGDKLYIVARGAAANALMRERARILELRLKRQGLDTTVLENAEWAEGANGDALRLLVRRYVVVSPQCPDWRKPTDKDYGNTPSSNFGCATAVNFGMMVADPRDMIEGRPESGFDGERASAAVERYRQGKEKQIDRSGSSSTGASGGGK